ncbi:hypothetical protein [Pseudomonas aeruginosa]|uniref:hypothetical protein n=1 Tax=Pseudomonas aeruginosa TaxID=287 RepID=UPI000FC3FC44|nr:hypothetical protein [Pseudomonas aeruginosa]RUD96335.1 hypothetical protein IPC1228_25860 [Pseudomonas aeruginosa]
MSYGALIRGDTGQTIIDDSNPCIHFAASGTYGHTTGRETVIQYASPIQSPYEPYVFVRPNGPHQIYLFRHIGAPGNWTGFAFWQTIYRDVDPPIYGGKWKAGAVMLPKTSGWGMQFFDTQSRVMFDSNRDIVRYVGGAQVWNKYAYNPNWPGGTALQTWYLPFTYGVEAYFQVSHFNVKAFITLEAPRIGFLENSMNLIFVSSVVEFETNHQFNWPLIVVA